MILIWFEHTQTSHMHAIAVPNWHIVIQLFQSTQPQTATQVQ